MKNQTPLVSICCTAFNHEDYIRDAIESFLMQETSFPFEIIIHDDASTDNTANIIKEYEGKHPGLFVTIYQTENQYSQGIKIWSNFFHPRIRGKYIALCEGDDYWTDPLKLQKQVELMEKFPEASMCVALNKKLFESSGEVKADTLYKGKNAPLVYFEDLNQYFHTSTYLIRKNILDFILMKYPDLLFGDTALRRLLINESPFVVLNEIVSVYRITGKGIWSSLDSEKKDIRIYNLWKAFRKHHLPERKRLYAINETTYLYKIILNDFRKRKLRDFPDKGWQFLKLMCRYDPLFFLRVFYRKFLKNKSS